MRNVPGSPQSLIFIDWKDYVCTTCVRLRVGSMCCGFHEITPNWDTNNGLRETLIGPNYHVHLERSERIDHEQHLHETCKNLI